MVARSLDAADRLMLNVTCASWRDGTTSPGTFRAGFNPSMRARPSASRSARNHATSPGCAGMTVSKPMKDKFMDIINIPIPDQKNIQELSKWNILVISFMLDIPVADDDPTRNIDAEAIKSIMIKSADDAVSRNNLIGVQEAFRDNYEALSDLSPEQLRELKKGADLGL